MLRIVCVVKSQKNLKKTVKIFNRKNKETEIIVSDNLGKSKYANRKR